MDQEISAIQDTLSTNWSGGGHWHILLNTDERTPRIQRTLWQGLHTVREKKISHIRGNLKLMTEAMCSEWLIGGAPLCHWTTLLWWEAAHVTMNVAMKGRIFHPHCDGWRIVSVAVIRDQLEEDPAIAVVTILDNSIKLSDGVNYRRVKICWLCCTHWWIKDMFSSYHAFVEYECSTRQV